MATYEELSAADKAVVDNTVNLIRAASGERARAWNRQRAIASDTNAVALVVSIDAGATIPNTSGLAGADDLTRAELVAAWNTLELDRTANDTPANRASFAKACGINATL